MQLSVSDLVLRSKQLEIEAIQRLAGRVSFADQIAQLIHALQAERGATSIFLAAKGQRFDAVRLAAVAQAQTFDTTLRALFAERLAPGSGDSAKLASLMAWVLLDLEALPPLRQKISQQGVSAHAAVAAFSRVIAGLVELIFQVAEADLQAGLSRPLVAFVHLVQGKESAGQERAVGATLFSSGVCSEDQQQRIVHLINAQERSLSVFEEFSEPAMQARWQQLQLAPQAAQLERLRRVLCTTQAGAGLDTASSERWFEVSSHRIDEMGQFQQQLVQDLQTACASRLHSAQQDLQDTAGLLQQLRVNPPAHAHAVERFFNAPVQPDAAPSLPAVTVPMSASTSTLAEMLQAQSARLSSMELELDKARRALQDRKIIERAKGALMVRLGLSEEAAFRALQKASMDHNRKLLDVAELALTLPDLFGTTPPSAHQK
ncbi:nitrate- and nitrite sensing domain-containing protein [Roseateles koreensis]|uniref:Nitrate- and nitrite sensing domain-containing protein n=1 Tax=Roseateles koreensis TaxID=2987526 RepID=A0ABT5KUC1_9BURK|nr:nitrate- and nitrite sensing domain-containing protein [Roseateles koreensis]MDC8786406.1 nitrate- and nitrite sensing domain-containing protein [Roseateles koreensis]